jgi:hypothetical protein
LPDGRLGRLRPSARRRPPGPIFAALGARLLGGAVTPTGTPGSGGGGGTPPPPTTPEQYATLLVLLSAAVFAVIGLFQGAKRSLTSFVFTFGAAWVLSVHWAAVAGWCNRLWRMFHFLLRGGPLAADPAAAWGAVKDLPGLVPTEGSAVVFWQLVFFAAAVLIGFGLGHILFDSPGGSLFHWGAVQDWLSRMFGAFFGSLTGATIAIFVLPRIVPGTQINMVGPGSVLRALVESYGLYIFWTFVILMIVAGLLALRPRPSNKVFN